MAHETHHIIPKGILLRVFGALVFFTILTVVTAKYVDIGVLNLPLAIAIALTKASLVVTFFMALRYDKRVNTMVFAIGVVFVLIFLSPTLMDMAFRGDLGNVATETVSQMEREAGIAGDTAGVAADTAGVAADTSGVAADTSAAGAEVDTSGAAAQ